MDIRDRILVLVGLNGPIQRLTMVNLLLWEEIRHKIRLLVLNPVDADKIMLEILHKSVMSKSSFKEVAEREIEVLKHGN